MALRSRSRRVSRPARPSRVRRASSSNRGRRVSAPRSRRAAAQPRATTIRVVVQSAPVPSVTTGAVSMDALKKARF